MFEQLKRLFMPKEYNMKKIDIGQGNNERPVPQEYRQEEPVQNMFQGPTPPSGEDYSRWQEQGMTKMQPRPQLGQTVQPQQSDSMSTMQPQGVQRPSREQIASVFGDKADMAWAIMQAESGSQGPEWDGIGDEHLMFDYEGTRLGDSIGPFQIRTGGQEANGNVWSRPKSLGISPEQFRQNMLDPEQNLRYAKEIYDRYGFEPWSTYSGGQYKQYLNQ